MKTGYFNLLRKHQIDGAVSIAATRPWYIPRHLPSFPSLAPDREWVASFKSGYVTKSEYTLKFQRKLDGLDAADVLRQIEGITQGNEPVLMCHCGIDKFCHRHLVADWLEKSLGIIIPEFGREPTQRDSGNLIPLTSGDLPCLQLI